MRKMLLIIVFPLNLWTKYHFFPKCKVKIIKFQHCSVQIQICIVRRLHADHSLVGHKHTQNECNFFITNKFHTQGQTWNECKWSCWERSSSSTKQTHIYGSPHFCPQRNLQFRRGLEFFKGGCRMHVGCMLDVPIPFSRWDNFSTLWARGLKLFVGPFYENLR